MDDPFGPVGTARYILLTSFKKDGSPISTPVWAALDNGKLYVSSEPNAGKVKRIRRNSDVTLQPCNVRGKTHGEIVKGTAVLLDEAASVNARNVVRRRYGIQGWIAYLASWLQRGKNGNIGIEITTA